MFGSGRKRGKRSKSKHGRKRREGDIVQTVTVNIDSKRLKSHKSKQRKPRSNPEKPVPKAEKPMLVDDSRVGRKDPYSAPKPTYDPPKEVFRPGPPSAIPTQLQYADHNPNGSITTNLTLANAIGQLTNMLPQLKQGIEQTKASKTEEQKFMKQSEEVGGANAPANPPVPTGPTRQQRVDMQSQTTSVAQPSIAEASVVERPDVPQTVRAQLRAGEKEIAVAQEQIPPPPESTVNLDQHITRPVMTEESQSIVQQPRRPSTVSSTAATVPRPLQQLTAFPPLSALGAERDLSLPAPPGTEHYRLDAFRRYSTAFPRMPNPSLFALIERSARERALHSGPNPRPPQTTIDDEGTIHRTRQQQLQSELDDDTVVEA
jgi:hypothetical protein